jgi:hypothetical protein
MAGRLKIMIRTADELKQQAQAIGLVFYPVHRCSMCSYQCGYIITGDGVLYDAGCDCLYRPPEPRDWDHLAYTYNMNQPENNPKISQGFLDRLNEVWRFPATV